MANRPEQQDADFKWAEMAEKNNNELLKNIGNFSVRILKFIDGHYNKVRKKLTKTPYRLSQALY